MDPKEFFRREGRPQPKLKPGFLDSSEETDLGDPILRAFKELSSRKLLIETKTGARYSLAYNLISGIESPDASAIIIHATQWTFHLKGRNLHHLFAELHAEERRHVREITETEALYELQEEAEAVEVVQVLNPHTRDDLPALGVAAAPRAPEPA
ncbi:MAG: hypothetical protein M5U32_18375 [Myxococcota bacterium]|nr:hypothetical protein [Myxococcota bacterium]